MSLADPLQKETRVVHSFAFKVITDGPPDAPSRNLIVTESDADGEEKPRNLEHFFYGIVGHVKDVWGRRVNGWIESSRLATTGASISRYQKYHIPPAANPRTRLNIKLMKQTQHSIQKGIPMNPWKTMPQLRITITGPRSDPIARITDLRCASSAT